MTKRALVLACILAPFSAFVLGGATQAQAPVSITMAPTGAANAGLSGSVTITATGANQVKVDISVKGLAASSGHAAHIHSPGSGAGPCDTGGPVVYPLTDVQADASGTGTSSSTVTFDTAKGIPTKGWYVNVHTMSTANGTGAGIICGAITAQLGGAAAAGAAPSALPSNGGSTPTPLLLGLLALAGVALTGAGYTLARRRA